jgi:cytochrome c556
MFSSQSITRMGKKMLLRLISISTAVAMTIGISTHAVGDTTPEDAFDYRKAIMTTLRGHLVAASMTMRGLVDDHGQIANHARSIANSTRELHNIFQEGSNIVDSESLPAIWEEPEDFAVAISKVQEAADAFVAAADSGDSATIGRAFRDLGGSCRGCHDEFRVAQN